MPAKIYGYEITKPSTAISAPVGGFVIDAVHHSAHVGLYIMGDLDAEREERHFRLYRTGQELPGFIWDCVHIRTFAGGVHLFEIPAHFVQLA